MKFESFDTLTGKDIRPAYSSTLANNGVAKCFRMSRSEQPLAIFDRKIWGDQCDSTRFRMHSGNQAFRHKRTDLLGWKVGDRKHLLSIKRFLVIELSDLCAGFTTPISGPKSTFNL